MLALALLATPSTAASRPRPRRGGALIDTRNRTDFHIKFETDAPSLALAASASRKPNKAAELLLHQDVLGGGGALFGARPDVATFHPTFSFPFNISKFSGAASRAAAPTTLKPIGAAADAELASFGETTGAVKNGDVSLADSTANSVGVTCGGGAAPVWCAEPPPPLAELCVSEDPIKASGSTSSETDCMTATAHSKGEADETGTKNKPVPGFTTDETDCTTTTAHSKIETGIGKTYPPTSKLNIGAYAELAPLSDETSGATKIGDPSLEESFTTATALSEIDVASLLFLHPCAAVLALLLAACLEPLLRGQVKKKRVEGRSHAAISVPLLSSTRALRVGIVILFFLQGVCGTPAVSSPCSLTDGGSCAASPNYPNNYGNSEECTISGVPLVELETVAFDVERCGSCGCDYLTVNGITYCGTSGPPNGAVAEDGVIEWRSDGYGVKSGWKICWATRPPSPPPPPTPPPLPPLPPLSPGYVAAASEDQLRNLITEAAATQANVSIYLQPSADFKLNSRIRCTSTIKVTVASSGEGATLDGQGETGLFHLSGRCSLTLRGLNLVNGRAENGQGGVVYARSGKYGDADYAGDVEIIESVVRDCSAPGAGGVVYTKYSGAVSITSSNVSGCSARNGGVVYAEISGAVSIIGSTVSGCSADGEYGNGGVVNQGPALSPPRVDLPGGGLQGLKK